NARQNQPAIKTGVVCTSSRLVAIAGKPLLDMLAAKEAPSRRNSSESAFESQWTARKRERLGEQLTFGKAHPPAQNAGRVGQPHDECL
ncbi:MAG TPA: hypothetical protein VIW68_00265, partial [Candidatus Sulfotelmatobacter sp.]